MKKTLIVCGVPLVFFIASCGDKNDTTTGDKPGDKQELVTGKEADLQAAVKASLKSQLNSITADVMMKVPNFIDLQPAVLDIPNGLEGREMVQVSARWPMVAKEDLFSYQGDLHELPDKPTVVEKKFSKGDEVEYIECNFVLQSDGGGGYVMQNSRFVKQRFSFPDVDVRSNYGKVTLLKGSQEHLAAAARASEIKKAEEEKARIAKLEEEKKKAEAKAKALKEFQKILSEGDVFTGSIDSSKGRDPRYKREVNDFTMTVKSTTTRAGEEFVNILLEQKKYEGKTSLYSGQISDDGTSMVFTTNVERDPWNTRLMRFMASRQYQIVLKMTDHPDKLHFQAIDPKDKSDGYFQEAFFYRKK